MLIYFYPLMSWALLALRISLAAMFYMHGLPKVRNSEKIAAHVSMPAQKIWITGVLELAGAASLLVGLLTQLGALAIIIVMAGGIYYKTQKWHVPFSSSEKIGWEMDLVILCAALVLGILGPGTLSLDWMMLGMA